MKPLPRPARETPPGMVPGTWPPVLLGCLALCAMGASPVAAQGRAGLRATASVVAVVAPSPDSLTRWFQDAGARPLGPGAPAVRLGGDRSRPWVATLAPGCGPTPGAPCDPRLTISFVGN